MLSTRKDGEPRFHVPPARGAADLRARPRGLARRRARQRGRSTIGFPVQRLSEIPAGTYTVQALFHRYETFTRATATR